MRWGCRRHHHSERPSHHAAQDGVQHGRNGPETGKSENVEGNATGVELTDLTLGTAVEKGIFEVQKLSWVLKLMRVRVGESCVE